MRFALLPTALEVVGLARKNFRAAAVLLTAALLPLAIGFPLAADTMRTASILLPVCVWGAMAIDLTSDRKFLIWLVVASLLVPVAHVTFTKIAPINSLPVELWRLLR